jgi:cobalt transporter subunit CbtB
MANDATIFGAQGHGLAAGRAETTTAALFAMALGAFLVFLTGFSHTDALHNGAHNTRHALSFPCH